ncbi:hypothetical protein [Streptomyces sp. NPDC057623]|uniref:hypothetical protein n=1 Tax=Streptomyces sp. NPDC057623 TaxID=3346187 RepID=UPI00367D935C
MPRDGSWLSRIHATGDRSHRDPVTVRVAARQLHSTHRPAEDYRLVTTLTGTHRYPARQLAALSTNAGRQ